MRGRPPDAGRLILVALSAARFPPRQAAAREAGGARGWQVRSSACRPGAARAGKPVSDFPPRIGVPGTLPLGRPRWGRRACRAESEKS